MKPYDVDVDFPRKLLSLHLRGFWDLATFAAFAVEFENALRLLHRHGGCEVALVDGSAFAVQSREVMERFARVMQDNAGMLAKRTATIVPAELNRMQSARVGENIARRDFATRAEAEAWLFDEA